MRSKLLGPFAKMSERDTETLDFIPGALTSLTFEKKMDKNPKNAQGDSIRQTGVKFKFVPYEVSNENISHATRDLLLPFQFLRHFDENRKSNRKILSPLRFFGLKTDVEMRRTLFNTEQESDEVLKFKCKLAEIQMLISRYREKGLTLSTIPDLLAESLQGMSCETYYSLERNISNVLWHFSDSVRKYQDAKFRRQSDRTKTFYNFSNLTDVFEQIFYSGYVALEEPKFGSLSGSNFVNFLKWRNIAHCGPYIHKNQSKVYVAVYVIGQYSALQIFNSGKPLHGLYMFETTGFKNCAKFEPLPAWFLYRPYVVYHNLNENTSTFDETRCVV